MCQPFEKCYLISFFPIDDGEELKLIPQGLVKLKKMALEQEQILIVKKS